LPPTCPPIIPAVCKALVIGTAIIATADTTPTATAAGTIIFEAENVYAVQFNSVVFHT
jgi:hypothetical protein